MLDAREWWDRLNPFAEMGRWSLVPDAPEARAEPRGAEPAPRATGPGEEDG